MELTRGRATPALNQSADETRTPASRCLPFMPLPRRVTLVPRQREATTRPLSLESRRGRRRGGPSGQVTVDQGERLSRVLRRAMQHVKRVSECRPGQACTGSETAVEVIEY